MASHGNGSIGSKCSEFLCVKIWFKLSISQNLLPDPGQMSK